MYTNNCGYHTTDPRELQAANGSQKFLESERNIKKSLLYNGMI